MADRLEVDLIVEAVAKGFEKVAGDIKKMDRATGDLTKSTKQQGGILQGLQDNWAKIAIGLGTAYAAVQTIKQAWQWGKEGAAIEGLRYTFDKLSASIGEDAVDSIEKLRTATRGLVADSDLMASANRYLAMGLATTAEETAKLSEMAVVLGSAMGRGPTQAMEEFALLLANQSIPRLDTFGISAATVRNRIQELQKANSDMSREAAFMTAVMEEGEKSMTKLGDEIPINPFAEFETQLKNIEDAAKEMVAKGLGPIVSSLTDLIDKYDELQKRTKDATEDAKKEQRARQDAVDTLIRNNQTYGDFLKALSQLDRETQREIRSRMVSTEEAYNNRQAFLQLLQSVELNTDAERRHAQQLERRNALQKDTTSAVQEFTRAEKDALDITRDRRAGLEELWKGLGEAAEVEKELAIQTDKTRAAYANAAIRGLDLFNERLDQLGPRLVTVGGRTADQNAILSDARREYNELGAEIARVTAAPELYGLTVEEAAERVGKMTDRQGELLPLMSRMEAITGTASLAIRTATVDQDALNKAFFESVQAAATSAEQIVGLGLALGELNEEQAAAILQQALMMEQIALLTEAYVNGTISADDATEAIIGVGSGALDTVEDVKELIEELKRAKERLDAFQGTYTATVRTVYEGGVPYEVDQITGGGVSGYRQHGGPVMAGNAYIVGERGPELFIPQTSGQIASNETMGQWRGNRPAAGNTVININGGDVAQVEMIVRRELKRTGQRADTYSRRR